jgi:hypothetical protein
VWIGRIRGLTCVPLLTKKQVNAENTSWWNESFSQIGPCVKSMSMRSCLQKSSVEMFVVQHPIRSIRTR